MKNKILIFCLISACLFSCEKKENKPESTAISPSSQYFTDFNNLDKMKDLKERILKKGDTVAYKELRYIYYYSGHTAEFLPYSLIMANDYNFTPAFYNVFAEMDLPAAENSKSQKLAKYYLFVAYEKNAEHAKATIKERFGESFIVPNSKEYWNSLNQ